MARIICVANQKGGVGKTTTAINLAVALAKSRARTLLIDLDPQCNATSGLGQKLAERHPLLDDKPVADAVRKGYLTGLDILPGSRSFRDVEALTDASGANSTLLTRHLSTGMAAYDFVLIDCPPSLGQLTRMALASSTEVFMPIQCEYFAMEGLTQMIDVIREVMHRDENKLEFGGILLTMYDHSLELTAEVDAQVRDFFGEIVYRTVIPRDVAVAEAPSHGLSVLDYAPRSRGSWAHTQLCMEVLERD